MINADKQDFVKVEGEMKILNKQDLKYAYTFFVLMGPPPRFNFLSFLLVNSVKI